MSLSERLRSKEPGVICPYDRRSPDYWTTPDDAPCPICGGTEAEDKCRGIDLSIMDEAATTIDNQAAEIERLRASLDEAVRVLRAFGEAATSTERCYTHALPDNLIEPHGFSMGRLRAARDFITKHGGGL